MKYIHRNELSIFSFRINNNKNNNKFYSAEVENKAVENKLKLLLIGYQTPNWPWVVANYDKYKYNWKNIHVLQRT